MNTIDLNLLLPLEFKESIFDIRWRTGDKYVGHVLFVGNIKVARCLFENLRAKARGSIYEYRAVPEMNGLISQKECITEDEAVEYCHQIVRKFLELLSIK